MVSKYFLRAHLGGVGGGPGAGPGVHDPVRLIGERLGVDREPGALQPHISSESSSVSSCGPRL